MTTFPDNEDGHLLAKLAGYGLVRAYVEFDGAGDSGQIEGISIKGLDDTDDFNPALSADDRTKYFPSVKEVRHLRDLVEVIAYELMERTGQDWYNNDGGWGNVEIVPGEGRMHVDMNVRYTTSEHSSHNYSVEVEKDCHG